MRFFQAIGASSGLKIAFTMIADTHAGEKTTRAVSYFMLIMSLLLALTFSMGGVLASRFGWEGSFVVMALFSAILMGLICFLPETANEFDLEALRIQRIVQGYLRQFKDRFLVWHALLAGLAASCYFLYATEGPYTAIDVMKLSPEAYGNLTLIPILGMALGCYLPSHFARRQMPRITMLSGLLLALMGVLTMILCMANGVMTVALFFLSMALILVGIYVISTIAIAIVLDEAIDKSNASAASQFINIGLSSIVIWLISLIPQSSWILPLGIGGAIIAMLAIWLILKPHHQRLS
jgi:MFS transporter, DHA1 family, multidrug resistance protein